MDLALPAARLILPFYAWTLVALPLTQAVGAALQDAGSRSGRRRIAIALALAVRPGRRAAALDALAAVTMWRSGAFQTVGGFGGWPGRALVAAVLAFAAAAGTASTAGTDRRNLFVGVSAVAARLPPRSA